jgi:hypothetical protein
MLDRGDAGIRPHHQMHLLIEQLGEIDDLVVDRADLAALAHAGEQARTGNGEIDALHEADVADVAAAARAHHRHDAQIVAVVEHEGQLVRDRQIGGTELARDDRDRIVVEALAEVCGRVIRGGGFVDDASLDHGFVDACACPLARRLGGPRDFLEPYGLGVGGLPQRRLALGRYEGLCGQRLPSGRARGFNHVGGFGGKGRPGRGCGLSAQLCAAETHHQARAQHQAAAIDPVKPQRRPRATHGFPQRRDGQPTRPTGHSCGSPTSRNNTTRSRTGAPGAPLARLDTLNKLDGGECWQAI